MPKCVAGSVTVPDVAARWASGEPSPAARTARCASCMPATAGALPRGRPGRPAEDAHDTHDVDPPSLLTTLSETDQFVPLPAGAAATGHPGVHMEMNPHRRRGVRKNLAELVHRPDRDSTLVAAAASASIPEGCSQVRIGTANRSVRNAEASTTLVVPSHPAHGDLGFKGIMSFLDTIEKREKQGEIKGAEIDELATQAKEKTDKLVPQIEQSAAVAGVKVES